MRSNSLGNTRARPTRVFVSWYGGLWSDCGIGSRTQWDVTKTFYLGVEVLYSNLHSAQTGTGLVAPANFGFGGATVNEANSSAWSVAVRAHRDFLP